MSVRRCSLLLVAVTCLVAGTACDDARPRVVEAACTTWQDDVEVALSAWCSRCHSESGSAPGYRTTRYHETIGVGRDGARIARAGDPRSRLLEIVDPAGADGRRAVPIGVRIMNPDRPSAHAPRAARMPGESR